MRNVRRHFANPVGLVFITQTCRNHAPLLQPAHRKQILLNALAAARAEWRVPLYAYVFLHDHVHLLLGCADDRVSRVLGSMKQRSANEIHRSEGGKRAVSRIWQARFYDHIIRDDTDLQHHLDYLHYNPVHHGLTDQPSKWPWSSFGKFLRQGLYDSQWGNTDPLAAVPARVRME